MARGKNTHITAINGGNRTMKPTDFENANPRSLTQPHLQQVYKMHYYYFHIGDYRKNTVHLSPIEHYIYRSLIDWYYLDETPIPKKTESVIRRLRLGSEHTKELENVLDDFFKETAKGWTHLRIENEISEYHQKAVTNRENGRKGGRPKIQQVAEDKKPKKTQVVSERNPTVTLTNNHKPRTVNQKPKTSNQKPKEKDIDPLFEVFYFAYPRKVGKKAAKKAFSKALNDGAEFDSIMAGLKLQLKAEHFSKDEKFIPHPTKWLDNGRWDDVINIKESMEDYASRIAAEHSAGNFDVRN
jgi:uncharacterized protein YdaU (DUF1376 family)